MSEELFLGSTTKFKVQDIVYNNGAFAFATGHWDGGPNISLACRWYSDGIGYPQTFGKPQWMLLPHVIVDQQNILDPAKMELLLRFVPKSIVSTPKVFLHTRLNENEQWENTSIELSALGRLPEVGENISIDNATEYWHRVDTVVHVAHPAEYIAEVYCTKVNHLDATKRIKRIKLQG
jgi:hypothetical protein